MYAQWIGGPTVLLELGFFTLLTDPMLGESFVMNGHPSTGAERVELHRQAPVPESLDLSALDLLLVSHLHTDHFDAAAVARLDKSVPIIAPTANVARLREWGFRNVTGLAWGESHTLSNGSQTLEITATPARHGLRDDTNEDLGIVNGYIIRCGSESVFWTGDTVWFDGLAEIQQQAGPVTLLLPHMGAVGTDGPWGRMTLDAAEAARLIDLFKPTVVIPIHHHTFDHYVEPISALQDALSSHPRTARLMVLAEGETWGNQ